MELSYALLREIEQEQEGAYYLLDTEQFTQNFKELLEAFRFFYPNTNIAYSYKTNYIPRLCKIVEDLGGYAEVVSGMEYEITKRLNIPTNKVHFNGPYKDAETVKEITLGGGCVNLDDYIEVPAVIKLAERHPDKNIRIGIRCNFNINDGVTSRFGFDVSKPSFNKLVKELSARKNIQIVGIQCHYACRSLDTWKPRAEGICGQYDNMPNNSINHIDLGGGIFGKMKDTLKAQFSTPIPSYSDYAKVVAAFIAEHFADSAHKPDLFIEPGSALVGDAMKFISPVVSIKDIRGKAIATLQGSVYNINPTFNKKNPPITIYSDPTDRREDYADLDFAGHTCIEGDYLYKGYSGKLGINDLVVFDNVGSYSIVLKPPFILPNFPVIELKNGSSLVVKRKETFDDLFQTYEFIF